MVLLRLGPLLCLLLLFFFLFCLSSSSYSPTASLPPSPSPSSSAAALFCSSSSSSHSFVCSCSSSSSSVAAHLRLSSSVLPDLLHHLVVHSCHHLTIESGTFRGKTVLEHIKFLDIARLDIRADSFRAIRRSPRLFLLRNVHLPAVPPRAFTGLSRLQHFWWRNISIGRVHQNAFAKVAFVDYLYFHTANIKVVDSGAFGHIHRLGHLFLRDGIRIGRMGARAFCGTRVHELVVEQATVKVDEALFEGLRASKVRLNNCWWGEAGGGGGRRRHKVRRKREEAAVEVAQMLIQNCTMHRLPRLSSAVISLFHVQHSTIGRLTKTKNPHENGISHEAQLSSAMPFSLAPSSDSEWHSLSNNSINKILNPREKRMGNLSTTAFSHQASSTVVPPLQLIIRHCTIRLLTFVSGPFNNVGVVFSSSVLFRNSSVLRWVASPFGVPSSPFSAIRHFLIEDSRLAFFPTNSEEGPFAHLPPTNLLRIVRSQMGVYGADGLVPPPFGESKIGTLELLHCQLTKAPDDAFLKSVEVREKLVVQDTQWPCEGHICGTEGLLLAQNSYHNLHWQFTSNRCFEHQNNSPFSPSPSLCASAHPSASDEFVCRRIGPLEECMCRRAFNPHQSYRHLPFPSPSSDALLFLIGDCPEHSLVLHQSPLSPTIQSLYIFRVRHLIIRSIPPSLRHLNILHTSVSISNMDAFASANLFELALDGSDLVGPIPTEKKLSSGKLGRIRLGTVNEAWKEAIEQLTEDYKEEHITDRWKDEEAEGGTLSEEELMVSQRRQQQHRRHNSAGRGEEEEEGKRYWKKEKKKKQQTNNGQPQKGMRRGRGKGWPISNMLMVETMAIMMIMTMHING